MTLGMLALSAALVVPAGGPPAMTLTDVVSANAEAVATIRSLVVTLKNYQTRGAASDDLGLAVVYTYRKQGDQERVTGDTLLRLPTASGDRPGYTDGSNGPDGYKMMIGYDPDKPPALGEFSSSRAYGQLAPRRFTDRPLGHSPDVDLMFQIGLGAKCWPLSDLVKGATSARLVATPPASSRRCYEFEVRRPEMDFLISVDPSANFMIRRIEHRPTPASKPSFTMVREVVSFKDCGDGIFLPTEVRAEMTENHRKLRFRTECEVVSCNRPIPPEQLAVTFPDWLLVIDDRAGKVHYWGPGDKPRLTFDNADEHQKWLQPRLARLARARQARYLPWSVVMGTLTVVAATFAVIRSRRRARAAA